MLIGRYEVEVAEHLQKKMIKGGVSLKYVECPAGSGPAWYADIRGVHSTKYCDTPTLAAKEGIKESRPLYEGDILEPLGTATSIARVIVIHPKGITIEYLDNGKRKTWSMSHIRKYYKIQEYFRKC